MVAITRNKIAVAELLTAEVSNLDTTVKASRASRGREDVAPERRAGPKNRLRIPGLRFDWSVCDNPRDALLG